MFALSLSSLSVVTSLVRELQGKDQTWVAKQNKRKRQKNDIFYNNPSFDPVFFKV